MTNDFLISVAITFIILTRRTLKRIMLTEAKFELDRTECIKQSSKAVLVC